MDSKTILEAVAAVRAQSKLIDFADRRIVLANLIFVHQVIVASERLLEEAVKVSTGTLRDYYVAHLEEERGHEKWLAADLASAGINIAAIPRIQQAVELAGSQYYFLNHVGPHALLGYMLVLEGFPLPRSTIELLEKLHGKSLLRTLVYHSEHDVDHSHDLFAAIGAHPSEEILKSAVQTANYINEFFNDLQTSELWESLEGMK
jgi:hypothetical protein